MGAKWETRQDDDDNDDANDADDGHDSDDESYHDSELPLACEQLNLICKWTVGHSLFPQERNPLCMLSIVTISQKFYPLTITIFGN